jgi:hypothetical protein
MALPVPLTEEEFRQALPDKIKKSVNSQIIAQINQTLSNPEEFETYRDNLLSYGRVMSEGRFKVTSYVDAVKFVSHRLSGKTNIESYTRTFPDKITRFAATQVESKDVASYVTAYSKSKLVALLMEQTLTPAWILNQDLYQRALNTQAELMMTATSEKVRTDAANSLLTHLKQPETQTVELSIGVKEDSSIDQLRDATMRLAQAPRLALTAGAVDAEFIAQSPVVIEQVAP